MMDLMAAVAKSKVEDLICEAEGCTPCYDC